jgi:hypothetical protein
MPHRKPIALVFLLPLTRCASAKPESSLVRVVACARFRGAGGESLSPDRAFLRKREGRNAG